MEISGLTNIFAWVFYGSLLLIALWGAFCVIMAFNRVSQKRFRTEQDQVDFLAEVEEPLEKGEFDAVAQTCEDDQRALPQLVLLAINNRDLEFRQTRQMLVDRFQRDVLADLDYRLSWVSTVIKAAPMIGLLGTVVGMMGAFGTLAASEKAEPTALASDIMLALITTACGLAIAIPLVLCLAAVNVRIRQMEDLVVSGLNRFLEDFRTTLDRFPVTERSRETAQSAELL
jgi:biopolymer transport protein ExbB/TolQ